MNFVKAIRAAFVPAYWRGLVRGVVPTTEHEEAFADLEFASIVDVGANVGQFSLFASHRWPNAIIHAFEPIPDQAARFVAVHGDRVKLHHCALGESRTSLPIHIASRKDSSSLLPLGQRQKAMFDMDEIGQFEVAVERLDAMLDPADLPQPSLLKVDVQGFEYEVLRGADSVLRHFSHVYIEVSFVELYEGQKLFPQIEALIVAAGFALVRKLNVAKDEIGTEVQADLLFVANLEEAIC
jgi:FkbM family methyltransferase